MTLPRTLLTGWFSFADGEVTAGDVLALCQVQQVLDRTGTVYDTAWSPGFRPHATQLEQVNPAHYHRLVFVCGPLYGPSVTRLHERFAHCTRLAVGVSVVDPDAPAARGFHRILARDAPDAAPAVDLSAAAPPAPATPVAGVVLTHGQGEYGPRRRHRQVADTVAGWLAGQDCAPLELDTRLATGDWRLCATPGQLESLLGRLDVLVTDRLHGLVLALRTGVPVLAVDPVAGGAKVSAQARACRWPALIPAGRLSRAELDRWWDWCLTAGREAAQRARGTLRHARDERLDAALTPRGARGHDSR